MNASRESVVFEAFVTPYRSLSARGLRLIIGFLFLVSAGTTTLFWMLGAWPIAGFSGVEILVAALLLRAHRRGLRQREVLSLSANALHIVREDGRGGRSEQVLAPGWLRVILEERSGRAPCLYLAARGRQVEVAAFLGEPEKRDLFEALSGALERLRHPVFDNPQLCGD